MIIIAEDYKKATGDDPANDDLERCNCEDAGKMFHHSCGWCFEHNRPIFQCGCNTYIDRQKEQN
jgi:hypothetical protein